jgi:hypothetical protein
MSEQRGTWSAFARPSAEKGGTENPMKINVLRRNVTLARQASRPGAESLAAVELSAPVARSMRDA